MARYELRFRQSVARDLRRLSKQDLALLLRCLASLADNPRPAGCEKLSNQAWYRVRQGVCLVYEIQDQALLVTVVKIGHRREVYRKR